MAKVKVFHDPVGNSLVVWFGEPEDETDAEETGDEVILMKDKSGQVIGFEKLNFLPQAGQSVGVSFETLSATLLTHPALSS
jgi:uncharacterized protein YuzE